VDVYVLEELGFGERLKVWARAMSVGRSATAETMASINSLGSVRRGNILDEIEVVDCRRQTAGGIDYISVFSHDEILGSCAVSAPSLQYRTYDNMQLGTPPQRLFARDLLIL
jgi:hypothetical protein